MCAHKITVITAFTSQLKLLHEDGKASIIDGLKYMAPDDGKSSTIEGLKSTLAPDDGKASTIEGMKWKFNVIWTITVKHLEKIRNKYR